MAGNNITASKWGALFYSGGTVTLDITAGATSYTVYDVTSTAVSTGSISGTATSFTPTAPSGGWPNGHYVVVLAGPSSYWAVGTFVVINNDARFQSASSWGAAVSAVDVYSTGDDYVGLYLSGIGGFRYQFDNLTTTTGGGTAGPPIATCVTDAKSNLSFMANWSTADSVRQPVIYGTAYNNGLGAYDAANIGNIKFTRRGTFLDAATITIGAGSSVGYKLTITDTVNSTTKVYDNCTSELALQTAANADGSGWVFAWGGKVQAPTETTVSLANTYTTGLISLVQGMYGYTGTGTGGSGVSMSWFEGPDNEPADGDPAGTAAFISTVHAANASAKALVPAFLYGNMGGPTGQASLGYLETWISAVKSMGQTPDGFSFHPYNMIDGGDIVAADETLPFVINTVKAAWPSITIFCTEYEVYCGEFATYASTFNYARQVGFLLAYMEQYVPKERFYLYYSTSHGYGAQPSWWKNGDGTLNSGWVAARNISERLYGMTFSGRTTFTGVTNKMVYVAKWTGGGNQTICLFPVGGATYTFELAVTGATSLSVYDWAGNESTVPVTNGTATITASGLGAWVTVASSAAVTVQGVNNGLLSLGANQADPTVSSAAVATSSTVAADQNGGQGNPGVSWLNGTDPLAFNRTGLGQPPWQDNSNTTLTTGSPSILTITPKSPVRVDRAVILCLPPISDSQQNAITSFAVQYQAVGSSSWTTVYSETNPTATSLALSGAWPNMGSAQSWTRINQWNSKFHFDCPFSGGPVLGNAFRILVYGTSYGQVPDYASQQADNAYSTQNETMFFQARFVGLYCTAAQTVESVLV